MAHIQAQFEQFNTTIRLGRFDENAILREKRDIIRDKLETRLPEVFAAHKETCPDFSFLDQGSNAMNTGIKPLDGDFDIDQGLYFEISIDAYPDPVVLKERVHEALYGHTDDVCIRRSCVTVFYHCDGEPIYHVDIAIYSDKAHNADGKSYTAKGKQYSAPEHRFWKVSDPEQLTIVLFAKFSEADRPQFRRIVRIWKRWKAVNFPKAGNGAPNGIGLTVAAYDRLQPAYSDPITGKHDDLRAMTPKQMEVFEQELKTLKDALDYAEGVSDPTAACERLRRVFGDDFPVPEKKETATTHQPAMSSSGNSA